MYIVTGALGFIGKHFAKHLLDCGKECILIDKITAASDVHFYSQHLSCLPLMTVNIGELKICQLPTQSDSVTIVNFAAESHVDNSFANSLAFTKNNVLDLHAFLENCRQVKNKKIQMLHVSTDEVYGDCSTKENTELARLAPTNPYSASKAAADMLVQTYMTCYDLNAKIIRPNNIFGSRQYIEKLIPRLFYCQDNDLVFPIHGTGNTKRHFLYVDDLIKAINLILHNWSTDEHKVYNVSALAEYSVNEVISVVEQVTGKEILKQTAEDRP